MIIHFMLIGVHDGERSPSCTPKVEKTKSFDLFLIKKVEIISVFISF